MPTVVSSSLPELDLRDGSVVTVDVGGGGAVITGLIVHGWQEIPTDAKPKEQEPLWLPLPANG